MAISREKKQQIAASLKRIFSVRNLVFVNFHGLSVSAANSLRRKLRGAGVNYLVAKKTLINRALDEAGFDGNKPMLPGETAVAAGSDLIDVSRLVYGFGQEIGAGLAITGGVDSGKYVESSQVIYLAQIPSREVLNAQLAWYVSWPITKLAMTIKALAGRHN